MLTLFSSLTGIGKQTNWIKYSYSFHISQAPLSLVWKTRLDVWEFPLNRLVYKYATRQPIKEPTDISLPLTWIFAKDRALLSLSHVIFLAGDHPDDDQLLKSPHEGSSDAPTNLFLYQVISFIKYYFIWKIFHLKNILYILWKLFLQLYNILGWIQRETQNQQCS